MSEMQHIQGGVVHQETAKKPVIVVGNEAQGLCMFLCWSCSCTALGRGLCQCSLAGYMPKSRV
jgi:hypothetical protein